MQLPSRIGKYELEEFLGGGMSRVYRARDTLIGGRVAIKILNEVACQDPAAKARFLAEARMARNVAHENVVSIYDFGEDDEHRPFMVMEFLEGEDLRQAIRDGHTGDLKRKLHIALQLARALARIHELQIIHRDIKPQNVHLSPNGAIKLMDFGIAKAEGLRLTRSGCLLGTPYYMAPEQVTGDRVTAQVDVYAFGMLVFELMAGERPIDGNSVEHIFYNILHQPLQLEPLRQVAPQPVCDLVARCTAKAPAERPHGFKPIIAELEHMLAAMDRPTETLPAQVPAPSPSRRPPAWMMLAGVAAVLLVLAGLYLALRPRAPTPAISTPTGDMVLVAAGEFRFGQKQERASLPAFYIDKTEVTNASYAAFCAATGHPLPEGFPSNAPDLPVVNVTIGDARDFARWAGKRLPKYLEWEKAARGTDGRTFPWGDESDTSRANVGAGALLPANSLPGGASPYGALQMVGNVWEFVDQLTPPSKAALNSFVRLKPPPRADEHWYFIRGQSYREPLQENVIWDSIAVPERWKDRYLGFRCVKGVGAAR